MANKIPKIPIYLIRLYLPVKDREYLIGDYKEIYLELKKNRGIFYAFLWLNVQVFITSHIYIKHNLNVTFMLLRNYTKLGFRTLAKNRLYTFINLLGLSAAVGWCILAYVNYMYSINFDKFHENADQIYRINSKIFSNNFLQDWATIPLPMLTELKIELSEIEKISRFDRGNITVKYGEKVFNERVHFADEDFFEMFTFSVRNGSTSQFGDISTAVISKETAVKYFGDGNPVGEVIHVKLKNKEYDLNIAAVLNEIPENSSLKFDFLLSYDMYLKIIENDRNDWGAWTHAAFMMLDDRAVVSNIENQVNEKIQRQNDANEEIKVESYFLDPLLNMNYHSRELVRDQLWDGMHDSAVWGPISTAITILLLSCFNFINTAIAYSANRLREIGIRKAIGGYRKQVVIQFLSENFILCAISILTGIATGAIFIKYYNTIWNHYELSIKEVMNIDFIIFLILLLVLLGIIGGAYPAFFISRFKPAEILKGNLKITSRSKISKILLVFQLTIAVHAIFMGINWYQNSEYQKNLYLGYDNKNVIIFSVQGENEYGLIKDVLKNNPKIINIAASVHIPGWNYDRIFVERGNKNSEVFLCELGENYFEMLNFRIKEGSSFNWSVTTDNDKSIMVNEAFLDLFEWRSGVGKYVNISGKDHIIKGVVKNFIFRDLTKKIEPLIFKKNNEKDIKFMSIKYSGNNISEFIADTQNNWRILFPDRPFEWFVHENWNSGDSAVGISLIKTTIFQSVTSIILACLGLFSLISLKITGKLKEIGIRKTLGAGNKKITGIILNEFIILTFISIILGTFTANTLNQMLFSSIMEYHIGFTYLPFYLSTLLMIFFAVSTIFSKILKAVNTNPVEILRYE